MYFFQANKSCCVSCVNAFKSLVTILKTASFSRRLFFISFFYVICEKSLSPYINDVTGENTFVTSALSDIVTGWLDEIDATFIRLTQCPVG